MVLVMTVLYHLRDQLDCQYNANNTGDDTCIFQISEENCRDLVAMDCIRYEESIYNRKRMSHISQSCCSVSLM